jgi:hypothetical protein
MIKACRLFFRLCFFVACISLSTLACADDADMRITRGTAKQSNTKEESKKQASLQQNQPQQQSEQKTDQASQKPKKVKPGAQKESMQSLQ